MRSVSMSVALIAVLAILTIAGCKGKDGTGDVTYQDNASGSVGLADTNPSLPSIVQSGTAYDCSAGNTYNFVVQTTCVSTTLYTYGHYACDQTKGDSDLLLIPKAGKDDHNVINVGNCGTTVADSVTPPDTTRPEDVVLNHTYTYSRTRNGMTFSASWAYTRDSSVMAGQSVKALAPSSRVN